jgi:hypothetical protein
MTDRLIDAQVYALYGLTEEEIEVVEGGEGPGARMPRNAAKDAKGNAPFRAFRALSCLS